MVSITRIQDVVMVQCQYLGDMLMTDIKNQLKTKIGSYHKQHGYLISIHFSSLIIIEAKIEMELNKFKVEYDAQCLKPEIGSRFSSHMVVTTTESENFHGAIVKVKDLFQILIVNGRMNRSTQRYEFPNCGCYLPIVDKMIPIAARLDDIVIENMSCKHNQCFLTGNHDHVDTN